MTEEDITFYWKPRFYVKPKVKKELYIVRCDKRNKLMYFYMDVNRKAHKSHSWCVFINEENPLTYKFCMLKLTIGKLKRVNKRLRRALNISGGRIQKYVGGGRSQNEVLKIYFTGSTKEDIIWD